MLPETNITVNVLRSCGFWRLPGDRECVADGAISHWKEGAEEIQAIAASHSLNIQTKWSAARIPGDAKES